MLMFGPKHVTKILMVAFAKGRARDLELQCRLVKIAKYPKASSLHAFWNADTFSVGWMSVTKGGL